MRVWTRTRGGLALWLGATCLVATTASAQQAPRPGEEQKIGHFVVDAHASTIGFKQSGTIATPLGVNSSNLPGRGVGFDVAAHVYPLTWRRITLGVGGGVHMSRSHSGPTVLYGVKTGSDVRARLTAYSPQVSMNFGHANGWSYLSGGAGPTTVAYSVDGKAIDDANRHRLAINYGAGGRWFFKDRLAFSFDLRFYSIRPPSGTSTAPTVPRMTLMVLAAGISFK
jgi:hypothetical protein